MTTFFTSNQVAELRSILVDLFGNKVQLCDHVGAEGELCNACPAGAGIDLNVAEPAILLIVGCIAFSPQENHRFDELMDSPEGYASFMFMKANANVPNHLVEAIKSAANAAKEAKSFGAPADEKEIRELERMFGMGEA